MGTTRSGHLDVLTPCPPAPGLPSRKSGRPSRKIPDPRKDVDRSLHLRSTSFFVRQPPAPPARPRPRPRPPRIARKPDILRPPEPAPSVWTQLAKFAGGCADNPGMTVIRGAPGLRPAGRAMIVDRNARKSGAKTIRDHRDRADRRPVCRSVLAAPAHKPTGVRLRATPEVEGVTPGGEAGGFGDVDGLLELVAHPPGLVRVAAERHRRPTAIAPPDQQFDRS
jgi:hypothetical protein